MQTEASAGVFGLLFVAFVVLKLCKVIAWSWWWVTAPLWLPLAGCLTLGFVFVSALFSIALAKFLHSRATKRHEARRND